MGKDKAKDKEHHNGEAAASSETITSPRDAHRDAHQNVQELQLRLRSTGHHPSQDNHQSSRKGDGKGSCTLPGYSQ